jgi:hypothetical protein
MKQVFVFIYIVLLPCYLKAQSHQKTKMLLDKTYQIDSVFKPYFGIQQEPINGIALIDENALKEHTENISTTELHATRDPFIAVSLFQFSAMHFRSKGLPGNYSTVTVNGIPMVDLANGAGLWNHWMGLNGIFRADENNYEFLTNSFAVAAIGSTSNMDIKASKQKAQTNLDYGFSNRAYNHRIQFTYSSGSSKNGWSFMISTGGQYTTMPMIPGTFHQSLNGLIGIDKQLNHHLISFLFFATNFQNARQAYTLNESTTLFNDPLYNPNWGYQHQQIRNANITSQFLPVGMFTHEWQFNNQSYLQTAISFSTGYKNSTGLNWFHAPDPRPDYYRYLPSYQFDPILKEWVAQTQNNNLNQRQINWDQLYEVNRSSHETVDDVDGIVRNTISGKLARYLVENRRTDVKRFNLASSYHGRWGGSILFDMGMYASFQQGHFYKTVSDLLGADFFVNWNQFAENEIPNNPNAIQFDTQMPNRIVKQGGSFGYDYTMVHTKTEAWFSTLFSTNKFRFSIAGQIGTAQFWRVGNKVNGLFPDQSYGKSNVNQFINTGIKLVLNYVVNGKQNLYISAAGINDAPHSDNIFISPSTRNTTQENLTNETVYAAELGYRIQTKNLKIHSSLYYIQSINGLDVLSFYHDTYNSFVNYAINGIGQTHLGYEFGVEAKLNQHFSFIAAATNGQHFFNSRQFAIVTADNNATELERAIIYAKNYPAVNSPQAAYALSLNIRSNSQWFVSISATLFDRQYMGWNPIRRTAAAIFPIDPFSEKGQQLLQVERMPAQSLINFFMSHGFKWGKKKQEQLSCSISINNLLNQQDIIFAGYEQLRFDFDNKDPNKFPPKYLHAGGRNFLLSFHYSF